MGRATCRPENVLAGACAGCGRTYFDAADLTLRHRGSLGGASSPIHPQSPVGPGWQVRGEGIRSRRNNVFYISQLEIHSGSRSSFRDYAAKRTHTPHAVMEAALAQTIRSKVEAAYARRIRRLSRSTRSLTTVSPPRPGLRTATRRTSAAGSSGSAQT